MMTSLLFVTLSALAFSSVIAYNVKNNVEREMELKEIRRKSYPKRTFDHFEHITSATHTLSNLHSISCTGPQCNITAEVDGDSSQIVPLRLVFWGPNVVRYWLAIDGNFSDTGTMDDVIVKTGMLFALLLVGAFVGWSTPGLTFIAFFIGLGLAFANIFKKQVSPALVLAYGAAEGVFLGGLSKLYATAYAETAPNLVSQAVMGTLIAFGTMLFLYKSQIIKVNGKFKKVFMVAMVSYLVIAVASLISSFFGVGEGWGFYGVGGLGMLLCIAGVALASFSLVMDFEMITQSIAQGAPEKEAWRMAFGLAITLVWLYTELLRLIAIFSGDE
jgi:uncharacterized YccA/Bax inhibitor family protein